MKIFKPLPTNIIFVASALSLAYGMSVQLRCQMEVIVLQSSSYLTPKEESFLFAAMQRHARINVDAKHSVRKLRTAH